MHTVENKYICFVKFKAGPWNCIGNHGKGKD